MLYSEEASQFEHPKHMLNIMVKKILQFNTEIFSLCKPVYNVGIFYFVCLFLLLYVPCQQLWSLQDGQFT